MRTDGGHRRRRRRRRWRGDGGADDERRCVWAPPDCGNLHEHAQAASVPHAQGEATCMNMMLKLPPYYRTLKVRPLA